MTDPFQALREPVRPADPDPDFAGRLRMRLTREVFASPGGTMTQQTVATPVEREPAPAEMTIASGALESEEAKRRPPRRCRVAPRCPPRRRKRALATGMLYFGTGAG